MFKKRNSSDLHIHPLLLIKGTDLSGHASKIKKPLRLQRAYILFN